jgi:uncharacterized protein (TIGR02284 family)
MEHKEIVAELNNLIELCKDGQEGYREAADKAYSQELTTLFNKLAQQRAQAAAELQQEVIRLGVEPETTGSLAAAVHREWFKFKVAISDDVAAVRQSLLEECERGENYAKEQYETALKKRLPAPIREIVQKQHSAIVASLAQIREWKQ